MEPEIITVDKLWGRLKILVEETDRLNDVIRSLPSLQLKISFGELIYKPVIKFKKGGHDLWTFQTKILEIIGGFPEVFADLDQFLSTQPEFTKVGTELARDLNNLHLLAHRLLTMHDFLFTQPIQSRISRQVVNLVGPAVGRCMSGN